MIRINLMEELVMQQIKQTREAMTPEEKKELDRRTKEYRRTVDINVSKDKTGGTGRTMTEVEQKPFRLTGQSKPLMLR